MIQTLDPARLPGFIHAETARQINLLVSEHGSIIWNWSFSSGERAVLRHRKPVPVSDWAERHRIIHTSSRPGRWQNQVTPYAKGIMDASFFPSVRRISIMKCPQSGGTEAVHNCIAYAIDRAPGPVLYVYPDEGMARENAQDRIIPMINSSPRLSEYLTGMSDDISSLRIRLTHLTLHMAWSGSPARLGNKPIRYLVMDELDKYQSTKNEAAAEALAEKRVITWGRRAKIWKLSTPTIPGFGIDRAFKQAEARFRFHVHCPACGSETLMLFEQIGWPVEIDDPVKVESRNLGYYACQHCNAQWTDQDRNLALRTGLWREEKSSLPLWEHLEREQPFSIAFHIPAWLSPFVSLSEIAAKALAYKLDQNLELLKDLQNNYKAEPWEIERATRSEELILNLCDDRPRGAVPGPVDGKERVNCLLAAVDTQKNHFYYVIRAFGYGEIEASWLVQCGIAENLEALDMILWQSAYADPEGRDYYVAAAIIDAMGNRTPEIYRYAMSNRGRVYPWQGVQTMRQPYQPSLQEYYTDKLGNRIKIPGGINLWRCDTTFFKNDLSFKLGVARDDPGALLLHANANNELEEYARQMCAEVFDDEKQIWLNPKRKANHYWDCEVMLRALAHIRNVRGVRRERKTVKRQDGVRGDPVTIAGRLGRWSR